MKTTTFKSWIIILSLAATSLVTVATSKVHPQSENAANLYGAGSKQYYVASNCPAALTQEQITLTQGTISSPSDLEFVDFGLPMTRLDFEANPKISGWVHGYQTTCYHSTMEINSGSGVLDVYSCYEDSRAICQVSFEEAPQNR
ncbi:MAG: hypothetical protein ACXVB1_05165 [Pseudobdellovibrionaceae bacterium]